MPVPNPHLGWRFLTDNNQLGLQRKLFGVILLPVGYHE